MLFVSGQGAPSRLRPQYPADDAALVASVKALNGPGADLLDDEEALRLILPALRGDHRACGTYRDVPGARLFRPVVALAGTEDPRLRWRTYGPGATTPRARSSCGSSKAGTSSSPTTSRP
ncbi:thioesterase domain-containing protein [Streptomyces sp. M19]